ncbi:PD-(D/E)XK nuclease family protein [Candidatus Desulfovibrio trichonymphae]|uniref:AddB-like putative DNA repair protein n=1 Tax=Candidatus Desulfovibrio trichonymphae TaxID=1725232 RepID=A0A1J1DXS7_9BACT|nr:PD-(D/E)XK nuclease family protein [Candidatus Desulfovibrio trichonymphae]BAV91894.1 AddB-like putative DNA repair protein [Candidatus Desulfovibrio trichonymphae]
MTAKPPFLLFPLQRPFLPDLKEMLAKLTAGRPGSALLIVPHNRPWRYLQHLYGREKTPRLLPKVMTIAEMTGIWRNAAADVPLHTAGLLDQIALLHACVQHLGKEDTKIAGRFARMDMSLFLPWGLRLASLLEELFRQNVEAADITHAEAEAGETAAALLEALGRISAAYLAALEQRGWTTPGLDCRIAARHSATIPHLLAPGEGKTILAAGFFILTGTENTLLHSLWQAGAHICLHTDAGLATGNAAHWSCAEHAAWLRRWKAQAKPAVNAALEEITHRPSFSFFAGYDCHSQLEVLREKLAAGQYALSTAIVLPDSALLMPTLHHLPDKDVNVSMGYPLARSALCRLIQALFEMQTNRSKDGRCYWRHLRRILRHPYLNMLPVATDDEKPRSLREALRSLEALVMAGGRFVDLTSVVRECCATLPAAASELLDAVMRVMSSPLEAARTTADIADWLCGVCNFLITRGGEVWRHFPLDAEAMYRLVQHTAPMLRQTCLAQTPFPAATLHTITRHIIEQERVPFEAEPIAGIQVIGMLETRLLHFDHVFIVDATEDKLPGNPTHDPLLPDSLRAALGLPDAHEHGRATAYAFYRLCAGAAEVHFFWQEGVRDSPLLFGKKSRSRFVEQLLWEEEQRRGKLLEPGEAPLAAAACTAYATQNARKNLARNARLDAALRELTRVPLYASLLDVYLHCPLRFAWQYLYKIKPRQTISEGDDPPAVGECLHKALHAVYLPWLGKTVHTGDISAQRARKCFYKALEHADLQRLLPADSCLMLESAAPLRLKRFLEKQPDSVTILALEHKLSARLLLAGREYDFTGILDRLDRRDGLLVVVDYKTGQVRKPDGSLWSDAVFFDRAARLCASATAMDAAEADTMMEELRTRLPSVQLPCYLAMLDAKKSDPVGDALYVNLGMDGAEIPLLGDLADEERALALRYCTQTLALVLHCLENAETFPASPDKHCSWCPYASLCGS